MSGEKVNVPKMIGEAAEVLSKWTLYGGFANVIVDTYVTGTTASGTPPKSIILGSLGVTDVTAKKEGCYLLLGATVLHVTALALGALKY